MPALALSRLGARVVESGPDGDDLAPPVWRRLEALPDPRSPRGRVYGCWTTSKSASSTTRPATSPSS